MIRSLKRWYHDSSFTIPKVKLLKTGELRAWEREIRRWRTRRIITPHQRDGLLALLREVGWKQKIQVAQIRLAAAADISVDTLKRGFDIAVAYGMLRIHHIVERGARQGGTVQAVNAYELVAVVESESPDPQAADERVLVGFQTLKERRELRIRCRRSQELSLVQEDERGRESARRQLEMLTRGAG